MSFFGSLGHIAGGLLGGLTGQGGADAAAHGSRVQAQYLQQAIDEYRKMYADQERLLGNQQTLGNNALNLYGQLLGVNTGAGGGTGTPDWSAFFQSPGYKFQLDQGNQALQGLQGARGNLYSGSGAEDAVKYSTRT